MRFERVSFIIFVVYGYLYVVNIVINELVFNFVG